MRKKECAMFARQSQGYKNTSKPFLYRLTIGDEVNFRLTYDGPLKAQSQSESRRIDKHKIRCVFSRQLNNLLNLKQSEFFREEVMATGSLPGVTLGGILFFAVVREKLNLVCDLDILFLRRDRPGCLIGSGGDLDNRIKVLFDALRMPQDDNEVRGLSYEDSSWPLVCLTEGDSLITGFRVTTDRLLGPAGSEPEENDVRLIINVEIKATKLNNENLACFSHF